MKSNRQKAIDHVYWPLCNNVIWAKKNKRNDVNSSNLV